MSTTVLLFRVPIWPRGHHLPLMRNQVKVTKEAHVCIQAVCPMVLLVYIDHNPCLEFTNMWLLQCPPLFCCCLFLFDQRRPSFATGEELSHSDWWRSTCMSNQLIFKSCSWSTLIIIHVLNSQTCGCCNVHHCFAVLCSYLNHRPSFATGDIWSQSDCRSTCLSTNLFLNGVAGWYWS
jgi:hypothetical protein